jgi:hypothetical protein
MTDAISTNTETIENDEGKEFLDVEGETESPEESARAVLDALGVDDEKTNESLDGSSSKETKPANEISKAASTLARSRSKKGETQAAEVDQTAPLQPPQGWDVKSKEWFLKQPREAQEEHLKQYQNVQGYFTKQTQEIQRERQEYGQFREALKTKLPEWGLSGISAGQALTELISVQDMLVKDKFKGFEHLLRTTGTTLDELIDHFAGDNRQQYQPAQQQNQQLTREEIANIIRAETQAMQQQTAQQREQQAAATELEQLRQEIGPDGRYRYPELWDANNITGNYWNNATWQRVQPLIEAARKINPNQRFGDTVKGSLETLRILSGNSGNPSPAPAQRFSQADELTRVRDASVSVRPRGNGAIPTMTQAKRGETPAESAAAILEMFNKSH